MDPKILIGLCLVVLALVALSACAKMPSIDFTLKPHLPCSVGPVVLDKSDVLSRSTKEQIVALDETGAALCGWTGPQ